MRRNTSSSSGSGLGAVMASPSLEISREMLEAGADAVFEYRDSCDAWSLADRVYTAMVAVLRDQEAAQISQPSQFDAVEEQKRSTARRAQ
jgi:hypothetical protein